VLEWIFDRCDGNAQATETAIGMVPEPDDLDRNGLNISGSDLAKLLSVDIDGWLAEVPRIKEHFAKFGDHLPEGLRQEVADLERRLITAKKQ
jgi:phosphoenolpyruvate carboxykinase (GTP)